MILDFKLTRNSILPTKYSVYKRLKPETDKLKQYTFRSMHHEKLEAWELENLPRKVIVKMEEGSSEIKELSDGVLKVQRERSSGTIRALDFRFSGEDDGVRKKKIKISNVLYKFVCGIKKM